MSAKLIALAAEIVDTNPAGSQLIVNLTNAETGADIIEALDNYDSSVLENHTEPVDSEDDGYVSLTDSEGVVSTLWLFLFWFLYFNFIMARRNKSASRQMVESLKEQLTEYFRENVFDDYDYEDLTGSELFEALVETFKELENDLKEEMKPIQYVLNKIDPEDSQSQVLNG